MTISASADPEPSRVASSQSRDRRFALLLLISALVVTIVRLAALQGIGTTVRVSGGSMAEALLGEHVEATCPSCEFTHRSDATSGPATSQMICPNCGATVDAGDASAVIPGHRVLIDRAAYLFSTPQRYDVVAFRSDNADREHAVKRIVALPGEKWEIARGDLLINGKLQRKPYELLRRMATVVHDDRYRSRTNATRWRPTANGSGWTSDQGHRYAGSSTKPAWLEYHHRALHPAAGSERAPIRDYDAYNSGLPRPLNPVSDWFVQCRATLHGNVLLHLKYDDGDAAPTYVLDPQGETIRFFRSGKELQKSAHTIHDSPLPIDLVWGMCDGRCFLRLNDRTVLEHDFNPPNTPREMGSYPAIGASGKGESRLDDVVLYRDIVYLDPQGVGTTWSPKHPLADEEYALLGDNSPLSIDSRQSERGVKRSEILGRIIPR